MTQMKGIRSDVGDRKSDIGGSESRAQRFRVRRLGAAFHTQPGIHRDQALRHAIITT